MVGSLAQFGDRAVKNTDLIVPLLVSFGGVNQARLVFSRTIYASIFPGCEPWLKQTPDAGP